MFSHHSFRQRFSRLRRALTSSVVETYTRLIHLHPYPSFRRTLLYLFTCVCVCRQELHLSHTQTHTSTDLVCLLLQVTVSHYQPPRKERGTAIRYTICEWNSLYIVWRQQNKVRLHCCCHTLDNVIICQYILSIVGVNSFIRGCRHHRQNWQNP